MVTIVLVRAPSRILLVEDEDAVREAIEDALRDAGHVVHALGDAASLEEPLASFRPDLAVLDVMLPSADGFALAREARRRSDVPVLFLTARDAVGDRLAGFEAGGDDYLVKPFVMEELLARIRALLRRAGRLESDAIQVGDLVIDEGAGRVVRAGRPVVLTATELRLLGYLARHRDRVLSKLQLLTQVWGYEGYDPNVVEVHVAALRRKLDAAGSGERLIHTERGLGYVLRAGA